MVTKNISIMEDVYKLLLMHKMKDESFSDLIRRSFKRRKDIMEFAGSWKDVSDEKIDEIKESINELRRKSTKELLEKDK